MEPLIEKDSPLSGVVIESDVQPGVRYRLIRQLGEGAMGVAYLAQRETREGASPVVVKVVHTQQPSRELQPELLAKKEAVALGRLSDRVPPSPFVVRFIDTGNAPLFGAAHSPWLAIEHVHGGVQGTTLDDRVTYSIYKTGYAFDPTRAAHAMRCLAAGLTAIHTVDVIHRDLTPGNVLCCGFGETEIFKISDFGVARSEGLDRTFGEVGVGTIGYAAPEQTRPGTTPIRPYTDVFALACVTYYLLTGAHYFEGDNPLEVYRAMLAERRLSIAESAVLTPELAGAPAAIHQIDQALARATAANVQLRPPTAERFATELVTSLSPEPSAPRSSRRLMSVMLALKNTRDPSGWSWTVRRLPQENLVVRSAAWDTDGRCLAVTNQGLRFWNGDTWRPIDTLGLPQRITFAQRYEAGGWLLGTNESRVLLCTTTGLQSIVQTPDPAIEVLAAGGNLQSLFVVAGQRASGPPLLSCLLKGRWLEPLALQGVAHLSTLVRLDAQRWLIGGRLDGGGGFVAEYHPEDRMAKVMPTPPSRSFVAGTSAPERELGFIVGSHGVVWHVDKESASAPSIESRPDLTAAAVDILDREWAASIGTLWSRHPASDQVWRPVWKDARWQTPFVSLMADSGVIVAMTADGGIIEGRDITVAPQQAR
jgi:serine/threonine protein kinase